MSDAFQCAGLGSEILRRLLDVARSEGLERVHSLVLRENLGMLRLCRKFGFLISEGDDPQLAFVELTLRGAT